MTAAIPIKTQTDSSLSRSDESATSTELTVVTHRLCTGIAICWRCAQLDGDRFGTVTNLSRCRLGSRPIPLGNHPCSDGLVPPPARPFAFRNPETAGRLVFRRRPAAGKFRVSDRPLRVWLG